MKRFAGVRNINFTIHGGERIGICGTTGSGKSSLLLALFRLVEGNAGRLTGLDAVDVCVV